MIIQMATHIFLGYTMYFLLQEITQISSFSHKIEDGATLGRIMST
jgi:hypothetical protein